MLELEEEDGEVEDWSAPAVAVTIAPISGVSFIPYLHFSLGGEKFGLTRTPADQAAACLGAAIEAWQPIEGKRGG